MSEHSFGEASEFTNKTPQGYGNGKGKKTSGILKSSFSLLYAIFLLLIIRVEN